MQVLVNFDSKLELVLACDAPIDLRMVLSHSMHAWWWTEKPIVFASHTLSCTERHYLQVEKRSPCYCIWSETFVCIYGWHFYLHTDQKSVSTLLSESRSFSEDIWDGPWVRLGAWQCCCDKLAATSRWSEYFWLKAWKILLFCQHRFIHGQGETLTITGECCGVYSRGGWRWWLRNWSHTGIRGWSCQCMMDSPVGVQSGISPGQNQALCELHGGHPGCLRMKSLAH